ncbi:MAG: D-glycero-beta-D-manno-heptose 1,7-bisphosphate 7-phosphatase [Phycisphaerales bacterium]
MPRRAVFLDRDDTLIRNTGVVSDGDLGDPDLVELLPGARQACDLLKDAGFFLAIVTNQGGVARGRYSEAAPHHVHERLNELLDHAIDDWRCCPYHPRGTVPAYTREHPWRKPQPGMLLDLAREHDLDLTRSWSIGDKPRDCEAGKAAGCRTVLIADVADAHADVLASDVLHAARLVIEHDRRSR